MVSSYLLAANPFVLTFFTWRQLLELYRNGRLDLTPVFQRGNASSEAWKSLVIGGFLQRLLPTVIALRELPDGRYQIVDGLQRFTAVLRFVDGLVRTPHTVMGNAFTVNRGSVVYRVSGKTWREIYATLEGKHLLEAFLDSQVTAMHFDSSMTDEEASNIFITLNDNTDMNPAEKLGGYLGEVSALFRLLARGVIQTGGIDTKQRLTLLSKISLKEGRRVWDDLVLRFMLMEYWYSDKTVIQGIYYGMCDVTTQRAMITGPLKNADDPRSVAILARIKKEVQRRCNIIASWIDLAGMGNNKGKKPLFTKSIHDMATLFQLTYSFEEKFGRNYKFNAEFATNLFMALTYLHNRKHPDHQSTARFIGDKTIYESLKTSLRPDIIAKKLQLILNNVGDKGITRIDNKASFSRGEVFTRWVEQNKKCAVTGLPLSLEDAVGGHRQARAMGHPTEYANLVVIHKTENLKMGVMSYHQYMKVVTRPTSKTKSVAAHATA